VVTISIAFEIIKLKNYSSASCFETVFSFSSVANLDIKLALTSAKHSILPYDYIHPITFKRW